MNWRLTVWIMGLCLACSEGGEGSLSNLDCERTLNCDGGVPAETDDGLDMQSALRDASMRTDGFEPYDGGATLDASDVGVLSMDDSVALPDISAGDAQVPPDGFFNMEPSDATLGNDSTLGIDAISPFDASATVNGDAGSLTDSCTNGTQDESEQGVDCGGSCPPCQNFETCLGSGDCTSGTCVGGKCVPTHCDDGIMNFDEEEVDCGPTCGQCEDQGCLFALDCAQGRCVDGSCEAPVCGNGVIDGDEECDDANPYRFDGCLPGCITAGPELCTGTCNSEGTMMVPSGQFVGRVTREAGVGGDGFGLALAKSNDQVFIGAPFATYEMRPTGSVTVLKKGDSGFGAVEELTPRDQDGIELYGASLAADRDTLLVGAPLAMGPVNASGVVYVYRRRGGDSWVQVQRLSPSTPEDGLEFGQGQLVVSGDTLVVGVPKDSVNGPESGAVYMFRRGGDGRFHEVQKIVPQDGAPYRNFGSSLSYENDVLLVGAPALQSSPSGYGRFKGAAYVFAFDGNQFSEVQRLAASGPASQNGFNFGTAVLLDGDNAFVTSPREDFTSAQSGVVYVFRRHLSGVLFEDQKFGLPESAPAGLLGMSLTRHKEFLLVGQPYRRSSDGLNNAGAVVVFQQLSAGRFRFGGIWENAFAHRNAFYGSHAQAFDDTVVISTHGDQQLGVGAGAVTFVKLKAPLCDLFGSCICEEGAEGDGCETLNLCGDGVVQEAEECDTAIFSVPCEQGCVLPNCSDGQQNGNETDIDCGGGCGATCANNEVCVTDQDCLSRSCGLNRLCETPSCTDGIQNGDECDVDCGSACANQPCLLGQYCFENQDCESSVCGVDGKCKPMRRLDGPLEGEFEQFGWRLAIDGARMSVGAPENQQLAVGAGAAYIYNQEASGLWVREAMLLPPDIEAQMKFGYAVDILGDWAIVGAPNTQLPNSFFNTGAAFVFKRSDGQWQFYARLVTNDGPYSNRFGSSVAIGGDYFVVGATGGRGGPRGDIRDAGAVYVFKIDDMGVVTELPKLFDPQGSASSRLGNALALDGDQLAVGSEADNFGVGAVLLFELQPDAAGEEHWILKRKLVPGEQGRTPRFGASLHLDGRQLLVGSPDASVQDVKTGLVSLYERHASGMWLTSGTLHAPQGRELGRFGYAVTSMNGRLLVSDQPLTTSDETPAPDGAVYVFEASAEGDWVYSKTLEAPTANGTTGYGTALDARDNMVIIGAPKGERGSVYLFDEALLATP